MQWHTEIPGIIGKLTGYLRRRGKTAQDTEDLIQEAFFKLERHPGAFLAFSPEAQAAIVGEAHRAGLTAQAHTMSVEGLRVAIEAGCDLIQHANVTGPIPSPRARWS